MLSDHATALFRILQEALTNVVRHTEATRVDISLTEAGGRVRLVVHDNGRGVPPAAVTATARARATTAGLSGRPRPIPRRR